MNNNKQSRLFISSICLLFIVIAVSYSWFNLHIVTDMQQFMPTNSSDKRLQLLLHETNKGTSNNLILVQLKGSSTEYLASLSKKLRTTLLKKHDLFESVINGNFEWDLKYFEGLFKYRYLLKHPNDFSIISLRKDFKDLLALIRAGMSGNSIKYLLLDPQKSFIQYLITDSTQAQIQKLHGVWFDAQRSNALFVVQLKSTGFDLDRQQTAINAIKDSMKKLDTSAKVELVLAGPAVIAVAIRDSIRITTQLVSWILTIVVLIVFWFAYRSLRLAFIAGIPLLTAIIVAIAITQIIFGELHGIVLAFGITLLGVCLDYPLHLFSHLRQQETATATIKRIWPTLRLGVLTSVFAYIALIGTGFSGLTQLAVFSATGLMVALILTRYVIPLWVSAENINKRMLFSCLPFPTVIKISFSTLVIGLPLLLLLFTDNIWSTDINQISPVPIAARDTDRQLRHALHAAELGHVFLIEAETVDSALKKTQALKLAIQPALEQNIISGIFTASELLPDFSRQKYYQSLLPDKIVLQKNVNAALDGLAFKKNTFEKFINTVVSSKTLPTMDYGTLLSSPLAAKMKSLLFKQQHKWYSVIRLSGVKDEKAFAAWLKRNPKVKLYYLSIHKATNVLMETYLQSAWIRLLGVFGVVVLIVLWQTRRRKASAWILPPIIAGVLVSLAVQIMLGTTINIFHVLSLLLVIGMGLDYSLFFNRDWNIITQLEDRTHAIIISAITTVAAFATLGFSAIPILAVMGQTVAVGIVTCFIVAQRVAVPKANLEVQQHCQHE